MMGSTSSTDVSHACHHATRVSQNTCWTRSSSTSTHDRDRAFLCLEILRCASCWKCCCETALHVVRRQVMCTRRLELGDPTARGRTTIYTYKDQSTLRSTLASIL